MRYLSLFTGIGGFELGIDHAFQDIPYPTQQQFETAHTGGHGRGVDAKHAPRLGNPVCIGYSEIDKYALQIYQQHFPDHRNYGDITKIEAAELPDFDFLCGGFPCQTFSIAGKRAGFADTRGTLFFDIARILAAKQPRLLLLENVKGLLSHDQGRTFATIIAALDELGYDLQWQVLNSKNHGVPQSRERVFIVGHLRGTRRPEVFPYGSADADDTEAYTIAEEVHAGTLTARQYANAGGNFVVRVKEATKLGYAEAGIGDSINLSLPNSTTPRGRVGKGVAQTLDTGVQQYTLAGSKIRRLTPVECERLQGFPDNWTASVSDNQRYKCLGNAVTVNVIRDVVSRMIV